METKQIVLAVVEDELAGFLIEAFRVLAKDFLDIDCQRAIDINR